LVKAENNSENSKKGSSLFFSRFSRESGKRYNHESGTQELRKGGEFFQPFLKNRTSWTDCRIKPPPFHAGLRWQVILLTQGPLSPAW
jgi:hypothetical protein